MGNSGNLPNPDKRNQTAQMKNLLIFLVDDDAMQNQMLRDHLASELDDATIEVMETGERCLAQLERKPDVVVLDYNLSSRQSSALNGLQVLEEIRIKHPSAEVIMLSGQDKLDVAVEIMKNGAFDYVVKSETAFLRVTSSIRKVMASRKLKRQLAATKRLVGFVIAGFVAIVAFCLIVWFFIPEWIPERRIRLGLD